MLGIIVDQNAQLNFISGQNKKKMKKIFHDFDSQFLTQSQIKIVFGNGGL
jgi:hypothetical protein